MILFLVFIYVVFNLQVTKKATEFSVAFNLYSLIIG